MIGKAMTNPRIAPAWLAAALAPLLLTGGCVRFGAKAPEALLTVQAASRVAPGATARGAGGTVTIIDPDVPKTLNTVRVAVRSSANDVAYVRKAYWTDTPRNLFRALLAETVAARNSVVVLDPGQFSADPGRRLMGELVDFGIDAQARQAVVTFDAVLMTGDRIAKRRFTAQAPIGRIDARTVAPAINAAANDVATQVADWLRTGG